MITSRVSLDCAKIHDWPSFHEEFSKRFGFPDFYGRNMDAWVSEPFFYYAKFTPFLEEYKEAVGVPFMRHTAMVIEKVPGAKARYEAALARMRSKT
jgi:hypothetical protein